jgi:hypothetical protein
VKVDKRALAILKSIEDLDKNVDQEDGSRVQAATRQKLLIISQHLDQHAGTPQVAISLQLSSDRENSGPRRLR